MKRMRLLSLLLALVLVCTAMPVTAAAADGLANATVCTTHTVHTEGQSAEDCTGLAPYLAPDGTAWAAVGDDTTKVKTWHCFQQDIDAALTDALHRMLRRETAFTLYIAVEKSDYDPTTGKVQKPSVTVKDSKGKALKNGTDYKISYPKGMKNVGKYTVKVALKGNYSGSKSMTYNINPKGTSVSKVKAAKKGFKVTWKKQATQTTGYQVQYSTSSKFKSAKTVTISKNKTTSKSVSKLSAKKKYYVRVRTYKTVKIGGKSVKFYSGWSKAKSVTTKK